MAVKAFKMGLKKDTLFYEDLVMNPCRNIEAVKRAIRFIRPEKDRDLGDKARWPRNNEKNSAWKDKSKWCAFHEDFGHMTKDWIDLRREINYLLSKGHLKELLGKKNRNWDHKKDPKTAESLPSGTLIVNVISGGSDICGMFDVEDMNNIWDPHHDGLVITLYISNCFVRRILVDNESSVNIIQLDT
ncbi:uncharacterized protein LOC143602452 [Bidens hawaiensis]|uniref:uncharacterized protein LOC143602452 n=1 Tax=Bidens hawaiensis TaxID=980011 RepID=UPI00404AF8AD